jgi:phospholipid/cholesterol/gamma-HCH transport system substrate-binding protein
MAAQNKNNIKLGLLVLAGLFLFILTLYIIGKNQHLFGSNFQIKARFENVNGLMKGNNIRFAGIQAGTVKSIKIINDTTIEVTMLIDNAMKPYVLKNAKVSVGTEGLIGNKIINIVPSKETAPVAEQGDLLQTQKIINTDEMLQTLYKTNNNIADISEELKSTVGRINSSTALWGILNEKSLAANLKASLYNISQASEKANEMVGDLRAIIGDVNNGKGSVGSLLKDTSLSHNLGEAVENIRAAGEKANGMMMELNETVKNIHEEINNGKGTVNALLKDPGLVAKLNISLDNVQKGTDGFNQNMEALKHNFLFRGYFRKLEKQQGKKALAPVSSRRDQNDTNQVNQ